MSETPTTTVEEQDEARAAAERAAADPGNTENPQSTPTPAYGLASAAARGEGPDEPAQPYELAGEDFSDLPTETRAELHRNAGRTLSTDSAGVDRVVSQHVTDWEPAPVEPDPAVVAHTERVQAALEAAQEERRNRLGLQQQAAADQGAEVSARQEA